MNHLQDILKKIFPFNYSVVSDDSDESLKEFKKLLSFKVYKYKSSLELNGWVIPKKFKVKKSTIKLKDEVLFNGLEHPMATILYSSSFKGTVSYKELKKHVFSSDANPDSYVYHWLSLYRPNFSDWGFCIPKNIFKRFDKKENYNIEIETVMKPHHMNVLEHSVNGTIKETLILNAHNCHPFQANDDMSGCAIGIKVMQELQKRKTNKSYKLLIAPELIGPVFWLKNIRHTKNFKGAIMLKSLGNSNTLKLQESFDSDSKINKIAHYVLKKKYKKYIYGSFRTIYGNDETVFDSPGYEIPSISLTRFPFKEYHTSADTPENISTKSFNESYEVIMDIVDIFDKNLSYKFIKKGLISLSNPKYNLYIPAPAPGIDKKGEKIRTNWNLLMNCLPRELDGNNDLLSISQKYNVDFNELYEYLELWREKKLVKLVV